MVARPSRHLLNGKCGNKLLIIALILIHAQE